MEDVSDSSELNKSSKDRVTILLPTLNEEESINQVIEELPISDLKEKGYRVNILVVDGKSTDRTKEIAEANGANVILQHGKGKGAGVRTAFSHADTDYLFMLDADGTYPSNHIIEMLEKLESGYDVVLGSRLDGQIQDGAMTSTNYFGNKMLTLLANALYGTRISDVCTGLWGFNSDVIKGLDLNSNHFEIEAEMFATSVKKNYNITEIPIHYKRRGETPPKLSPVCALGIARKLIARKFISMHEPHVNSGD
jgi:dolichol-phosphate mannosyltransferase